MSETQKPLLPSGASNLEYWGPHWGFQFGSSPKNQGLIGEGSKSSFYFFMGSRTKHILD